MIHVRLNPNDPAGSLMDLRDMLNVPGGEIPVMLHVGQRRIALGPEFQATEAQRGELAKLGEVWDD